MAMAVVRIVPRESRAAPGKLLLVRRAVGAETVNFQPVARNLEVVDVGRRLQRVLYIAADQVARDLALGTDEVMVVAAMAQLIAQPPVFQQNATQDVRVHQYLQVCDRQWRCLWSAATFSTAPPR